MALGSSAIGAAGGGGHLGTMFFNITANSAGVVKGMKSAEAAVAGGSTRILAAATKMSLGVVAAFGAIAAVGVVQFGQFEKAMTKSTAIMTDVTIALRKEMEATARQLATTSVTSSEELAEAYFFLASAGLSAKQSIAALSTVNAFAIAGQFDMALATDLLTDAQSALGLTVKDTTENMRNMTRISDVLVKANTLANATVQQFSSSLTREAGAAMKSFNIDVEEGVAVLAAFADQGVKGEIAGTSFSRILRLMTSAAVNNRKAYKDLDVNVFSPLTGNLNNMADIVRDLEGALGDLSDEERVVALDTLGFQARVQGVILPLLGTSDAIKEYEKNLRRAGGTTQDVADKQMQNFFDQLTITWNRIKDILLTIGEKLTPVLRVLNGMLQETVGTADEVSKSFNHWSTFIAPAFITVAGLIGDAIFGWQSIIAGLRLGFAFLTDGVSKAVIFILEKVTALTTGALKLILRLQEALQNVPGAADLFGKGINVAPVANLLRQLEKDVKVGGAAFAGALKAEQKEFDNLMAKGKFSDRLQKKYDEMVRGAKEANKDIAKDTVETAEKTVSDLDRISKAEATSSIDKMFTGAFGEEGSGGGSLNSPLGQDPASFQLEQFKIQQDLAEENLQKLADISEQEITLSDDTNNKKLELMAAYNEQVRQLQIAQAQIILGSAEQMFGDLTQIAGTFAGEQSGIYKGLFALSKAFAIADATVKIAQGIAGAAALPFPANIPAMASVVAATTSIISSIQAVQLEFGGGKAAGGPVASGKTFLVGEKGPELFSPGSAGNITPNSALGGEVKVTVNNFTSAKAEVRETNGPDGREVEIIIQQTKNSIASDIQEGRGAVPKAMKSSFGLKRNGNK
jgi:TP901 family phage tail tape measure protein